MLYNNKLSPIRNACINNVWKYLFAKSFLILIHALFFIKLALLVALEKILLLLYWHFLIVAGK